MENKGVELSLTHRNKIHGVNYSLTGTFTKNKNEITSMAGKNSLYFFSEGKPIYSGSDYVTAIKEGYEAGAFFVMPTNGVINTEQKSCRVSETCIKCSYGRSYVCRYK